MAARSRVREIAGTRFPRQRAQKRAVGKAVGIGTAAGQCGRRDGKGANPRKQARAGLDERTHDLTHSKRNSHDERLNQAGVNKPLISATAAQP
jgi:hypothetical protein